MKSCTYAELTYVVHKLFAGDETDGRGVVFSLNSGFQLKMARV